MSRISGALMSLTIDGDDYSDQVSTCEITEEAADSEFLSMDDAANGGSRLAKLHLVFAQDLSADTLLRQVIENSGDEVPFVFAPYRNETPSTSQPHVIGTAVISRPDGVVIGGETAISRNGAKTVDVSWEIPLGWTLKTTAGA